MIQQALLWAAAGTGFTFLMTTIGAAMVFFMKRQSSAPVSYTHLDVYKRQSLSSPAYVRRMFALTRAISSRMENGLVI